MKLILYILALVSIGGAAALSMMNIEKHENQLYLTKKELKKVINKKGEVTTKEGELQTEQGLRADAKKQNNDLIADRDNVKKPDLDAQTKLSASYDDDLEDLVSQKDKINKTIVEIEKELEGEKIALEDVAQFVTNLENEKKELNKTNIVLQDEIEVFSGAVKQNNAVLGDFRDAQMKRRKNLAANKVSSLITAVDSEWGFVVVKPHSEAIIKQESKLLVIRGNKHIGRLTINAIEDEGGRVLANIDYASLAPGMRIRPGDRVILSQPLTK